MDARTLERIVGTSSRNSGAGYSMIGSSLSVADIDDSRRVGVSTAKSASGFSCRWKRWVASVANFARCLPTQCNTERKGGCFARESKPNITPPPKTGCGRVQNRVKDHGCSLGGSISNSHSALPCRLRSVFRRARRSTCEHLLSADNRPPNRCSTWCGEQLLLHQSRRSGGRYLQAAHGLPLRTRGKVSPL